MILHFRLTITSLSLPHAERFDQQQMDGYAPVHLVHFTPSSSNQVFLPYYLDGHGFISLTAISPSSYAANHIESSTLCDAEHSPAFYQ